MKMHHGSGEQNKRAVKSVYKRFPPATKHYVLDKLNEKLTESYDGSCFSIEKITG